MSAKLAATVLFLISVIPTTAIAHELNDHDRNEIKELAIEAVLENPEVIEQAITRLRELQDERQAQQVQATIEERRDELLRDPNAPVIGNPDGDVTIVEFFDYNCPYCKRAAPVVDELLEGDENIRLVYREFPILSESSVFAAKAALASRKQGKYPEFHRALMATNRVDEAATIEVAGKIGLDIEKLKSDMEAPEVDQHIQLSMGLANALGITGTPSFVIGSELAPGLIQLNRMQSMVSKARERQESKSGQ